MLNFADFDTKWSADANTDSDILNHDHKQIDLRYDLIMENSTKLSQIHNNTYR